MTAGILITLALVAGCLGAGRAVLAGGARLDGVAGLSGLAALSGLAGWIVLAGAYSTAAGWGLLAFGGAFLLVGLFREPAKAPVNPAPVRRALPLGAMAIGLLTLTLALGRLAGELVIPFEEPWDDWPSYWHFPRLLLESGGFVEPFNLRRLSALGAAQFVQSYYWPAFRLAGNGVTDAVLGQLLLWAVVRQLPDGTDPPAPAGLDRRSPRPGRPHRLPHDPEPELPAHAAADGRRARADPAHAAPGASTWAERPDSWPPRRHRLGPGGRLADRPAHQQRGLPGGLVARWRPAWPAGDETGNRACGSLSPAL